MCTRAPDLVVLGAHVFAPGSPTAVAVTGGRIIAVGADDEVRDLVGPRTEVVDLAGRLLLPGFQDAHVHPVPAGARADRSCDLTGARSPRSTWRVVRGVRRGAPRPGVDPRRRLVDGGLPRRHADPASCWTRWSPTGRSSCPTGTTTAPGSTRRALELAGIDRATPRTRPTAGSSATPDGDADRHAARGRDGPGRRRLPAGRRRTSRLAGLLAGAGATALARHHRLAGRDASASYVGMRGRPAGLPAPPPETGRSPPASSARCGGTATAVPSRSPSSSSGGSACSVRPVPRRARVKIMQDGVAENFTAGDARALPRRLRLRHRRTAGCRFVDPDELRELRHRAGRRSASRCTSTRSATGRCARRSTRSRPPGAANGPQRHPAPPRAPAGRAPRRRAAVRRARRDREHPGAVGGARAADGRADHPVPRPGRGRAGSTRSATCCAPGPRLAAGSDWPVSSADPLAASTSR